MSRLFSVLLILLLLSGGLAAGVFWFLDRLQYEVTDNAYLKTNQVSISPRVSGYVAELFINDNQFVQKGDVLLTLGDPDFQAKVALAEARVAEEPAHIQRLEAMKVTQHAHIDSKGADVAEMKAKREQIQQDLQRYNILSERGSISKQELEKMQSAAKQALAQLQSSQAEAVAEHKQLGAFDSEKLEAEAGLKKAQAELTLAKIDLGNTKVRAPFDGVIGNRNVQVGQLVSPQASLASLVETGKIWIEANFKETQLANMRIGQPVTIEIDAFPEFKFTGKVTSFSPASGAEFSILPPENATGNFTKIVRRVPVKIEFDINSDTRLLKSGLSATVRVKVK